MFFGLTNSSETFQMIIYKILQDLINTRKVASFIDDVIVGIEKEEEHREIVEEVVRRLVENNLYVKPKKYKWKVRKSRFLEVVIGLKETKMKEEKIKGVLDWPTPKEVKNIQKFFKLANYYQQFIKDLHNFIKKDWKWDWTEK